LYEGYERIEIYGFEMSSGIEYSRQKAGAEFWLGFAKGLGIEIYLPPGCKLLGENEPLYGYDQIPGLHPQLVELKKDAAARQEQVLLGQMNALRGQEAAVAKKLENTNYAKKRPQLQKELFQIKDQLVRLAQETAFANGQKKAFEFMLADYAGQRRPEMKPSQLLSLGSEGK
jgi:hypothetical protein